MKLRNKKTGEILYGILGSYPVSGDATIEFMDENAESGYSVYARYKTLAELNEEWEDYTPAEPLIKDEKIRRAVRAWADYNGVEEAFYFTNGEGGSRLEANYDIAIKFYNELTELKHWEKYTIAELCREGEE